MRSIKLTTVTLLALIFLLPISFYISGSAGFNLAGVEKKTSNVQFTFKNLYTQKFQDFFEPNFQRNFGVLNYLIRTDNQLDYFAFKTASSNPKSSVILGRNNHLIERPYIRNANHFGRATEKKLIATAEKLKNLQRELAKSGVALVFVISPNKPSYYPEALPERYKVAGAADRLDPRTFMITKLKERSVNFIDGFSFLKEMENSLNLPMFATTGTHWNELGGCLVASEIMRKAEQVIGKPQRQINCHVEGLRGRPAYQDMDLLRIANFWFPSLLYAPAPNVDPEIAGVKNADRPKLLLIGSSFCWEILRQFERVNATSDNDFLYYFKRLVKSSQDKGRPIDKENFKVRGAIAGKDLVIIEINQAFLIRAGFGFAEAVLSNSLS